MDQGQQMSEEEKLRHDRFQKQREVLFSNESFLIGMLQVVAGGSLFAGLAQTSAIITLVGQRAFLGFLTLMAMALVAAVLAAYCKHQYHWLQVRGAALVLDNKPSEAILPYARSSRHIDGMRRSILLSMASFGLGILGLLAFSWVHALQPAPSDSTLPVSGYMHPRA
jgi:hypothetical protein